MLNFNKMRKLSYKMKNESFAYAERFLQKIFDSLEFNEDYTFSDGYDFYKAVFPEGADPNEQLEDVYFNVDYNCTGEIAVIFRYNEPFFSVPVTSSILYEVLLKNGFTRIDEEYRTIFTRVI